MGTASGCSLPGGLALAIFKPLICGIVGCFICVEYLASQLDPVYVLYNFLLLKVIM